LGSAVTPPPCGRGVADPEKYAPPHVLSREILFYDIDGVIKKIRLKI